MAYKVKTDKFYLLFEALCFYKPKDSLPLLNLLIFQIQLNSDQAFACFNSKCQALIVFVIKYIRMATLPRTITKSTF